MPTAIDATPPRGVARGHTNAASSAGVMPAPYIVYAQSAIARMVGKKLPATNADHAERDHERTRVDQHLAAR